MGGIIPRGLMDYGASINLWKMRFFYTAEDMRREQREESGQNLHPIYLHVSFVHLCSLCRHLGSFRVPAFGVWSLVFWYRVVSPPKFLVAELSYKIGNCLFPPPWGFKYLLTLRFGI